MDMVSPTTLGTGHGMGNGYGYGYGAGDGAGNGYRVGTGEGRDNSHREPNYDAAEQTHVCLNGEGKAVTAGFGDGTGWGESTFGNGAGYYDKWDLRFAQSMLG